MLWGMGIFGKATIEQISRNGVMYGENRHLQFLVNRTLNSPENNPESRHTCFLT
jgi:hypothetical protein